jgi:pyruvate dehydrogenase (quinone)
LTQAKNFMSMLLHGDPEQGSVIKNTAKELLSSVLPRRRGRRKSPFR